ncbi:PREDICTED: tectonic-1 [Gekko japonicus]|uniref:Tectonic-1 n=1 Tax=Gekko japonicus TaxID=146911 RepID=A0ABM1KBY6_GEKJA|nr:PREDICTED: tectonic-1 [Gekko japonicus]
MPCAVSMATESRGLYRRLRRRGLPESRMGPGAALLGPLAWCLLVLPPPPVAPSTAVPTPSPSSSALATSPGEASTGPQTEGVPGTTPDTSQGPTAPGEETPASEPSPSAGSPAETPGPSPASTRGPSSTAGPTLAPHPGPWPQPVTDVAKLCVCDLLVDQCDVNCCCDPACTAADFSLFTECSVPVVTGDIQLCRQQEALYSMDTSVHPPERTYQLADKVNPSVFCIQTVNYKAALSFQSPEIPTLENFDSLLQDYGGNTFSTETDLTSSVESGTGSADNAGETSRYEYRDPIETADGFLWLPAPLFFSQCTDSNPAGFLVNQAVECNRMIQAEECATIPALSMDFYTSPSILPLPKSSRRVNVTIQSITVQTLQGLRTRLNSSDVLFPTSEGQACSNVVLEAKHLITFTEAGEITAVAASLVLATIDVTSGFIRQSFEIHFIPQNTRPVALSGNPGYVVGLPIKAGFRSPGSGIIQTAAEDGQFTMLKSTPAQDCLAVEGIRTPVLFGYNMMSGCQLRLTKDAECQVLAPALLNTLKGQNFPEVVASFGNSEPQNGLDWVQIVYNGSRPSGCEIPVRFEIRVEWTKYGSLLNPQAKLTGVTVTVVTAALPQGDPGSERTIPILSTVTFVDVSAAAEPGYRSRPAVEAKLPFDFFFPFV